MSKSYPPDVAAWDDPAFAIDESPDSGLAAPEVKASIDYDHNQGRVPAPENLDHAGEMAREFSANGEALEEIETALDRLGRDLYKQATRLDTLLSQVSRLRSDVTTLLEWQQSEDKITGVIKTMLPLLDSLSNLTAATRTAAAHAADSPASELIRQLTQAATIVQEKSAGVLKDLGITALDSRGKPYDSKWQVVVDTVNQPELPPLVVVEEESRGYLYREEVLRRAQVIVNKPIALAPPVTGPTPKPIAGSPESASLAGAVTEQPSAEETPGFYPPSTGATKSPWAQPRRPFSRIVQRLRQPRLQPGGLNVKKRFISGKPKGLRRRRFYRRAI